MSTEMSTVTLANGLGLSYAERGTWSDRALVLLPGPTDSWRSYQPVLEQIPHSIRAVAVSQRGHGDSDKPATGYQIEDFAADAVALLDALCIEQAVLAGHSGSCLVARRIAIDRPERVVGLVLEASPTSLKGDAHLSEFVASVVSTLEDPIDLDFVRSFVVGTSSDRIGADLVAQLVREVLKVPARAWREMFAGLLGYDDMAELRRIAAPVRLVWGDADGLIGRDMQDQLVARVPSGELVVYPGIGHTPRWEEPSRFAADVAAFVERQLLA